MKKLALSLAFLPICASALLAQNNIGFYGGFNINMHSPSFGDKTTVLFDQNATGVGLHIGGIGNFEIKKNLFFSARVGYNVCSADLDGSPAANNMKDYQFQSKLHYFELTPAVQIFNLIPVENSYLLGGLEFGIPVKAKYDYKVGDTTTTDQTITSNSTRIALALGGGYRIKMNNGMTLSPELSIRIPFNQVSSDKRFDSWNVTQIRLGVALTFDISGKKEEAKVDSNKAIGNIDVGIKEVRYSDASGKTYPVKFVKLEETRYTEQYPIVPFIFFNENSNLFDKEFQRQKALEARGAFKMTDLPNDGLEINRQTLDVIGVRMNEIRNAQLTITGTIDGKAEKGNATLAQERAEAAKNYLIKKYAIDESRIEVKSLNLPERPSAQSDTDGVAENRRIEFSSNIPELLDPVKIESDKERLAAPDLMEFVPYAKADAPIQKWTLTILQAGRQLRYFEGTGEPQIKQWVIRPNELAASNVPIDYKFFAVAEDGSQKEFTGTIPVDYKTGVKSKTEESADKSINKFSLILFDFDKSEVNADNMRIIEQMVMPVVKYNSTIKIYGLTDRIGDEKYNKKLSTARAQAVKKDFESKMKDVKIEVYGLGEDNLIYDNGSPIGRQLCRTVQIIVETPKK